MPEPLLGPCTFEGTAAVIRIEGTGSAVLLEPAAFSGGQAARVELGAQLTPRDDSNALPVDISAVDHPERLEPVNTNPEGAPYKVTYRVGPPVRVEIDTGGAPGLLHGRAPGADCTGPRGCSVVWGAGQKLVILHRAGAEPAALTSEFPFETAPTSAVTFVSLHGARGTLTCNGHVETIAGEPLPWKTGARRVSAIRLDPVGLGVTVLSNAPPDRALPPPSHAAPIAVASVLGVLFLAGVAIAFHRRRPPRTSAGVPRFLEFALEIRPGTVKGGSREVGEATAKLVLPFDAATFRRDVEALTGSGRGSLQREPPSPPASAAELGGRLFDAVITGDVRGRFDAAAAVAAASDRGLRIRLEVAGDAPGLAAIPWEILHDPRPAEFLCLRERTPIVRSAVVAQPVKPLAVTPPLCILGVAASPTGLPALDVEAEHRRIEDALRGVPDVALKWRSDPSPAELLDVLRGEQFHVLHFAGHGGVDECGCGYVALSEGGREARLDADNLGVIFAEHASLRLLVLNACEGATIGGEGVGQSLATRLLGKGVPAVLAMQFPISDAAAIALARVLYEALARGLPLETALAQARKAVFARDRARAEWATPVLYMRAAEGRLFVPAGGER